MKLQPTPIRMTDVLTLFLAVMCDEYRTKHGLHNEKNATLTTDHFRGLSYDDAISARRPCKHLKATKDRWHSGVGSVHQSPQKDFSIKRSEVEFEELALHSTSVVGLRNECKAWHGRPNGSVAFPRKPTLNIHNALIQARPSPSRRSTTHQGHTWSSVHKPGTGSRPRERPGFADCFGSDLCPLEPKRSHDDARPSRCLVGEQ
jgi:hypothetical protein